jgi:hypothetical protein
MTSITIEISGPAAERLRQLAESEQRSAAEIVGDALEAYAPSKRRLPRGVGKYRSDRKDTSHRVDEILRSAVEEGRWP